MAGVTGPAREMTPDELVAAAERMVVANGDLSIPALWPRMILERERASRQRVLVVVLDQVIENIDTARIDRDRFPQTKAYNDGWRDALAALRDELKRPGGLTS